MEWNGAPRDPGALEELALPGEAWPLLAVLAAQELRESLLRRGGWADAESALEGRDAGGTPWSVEEPAVWPRVLALLLEGRPEDARPLLDWLAAGEGEDASVAARLQACAGWPVGGTGSDGDPDAAGDGRRGAREADGAPPPPWSWLSAGGSELEAALRAAPEELRPVAGWLLARRLLAERQCASALRRWRACRRAWSGRPALERLALVAEGLAWERMGRDDELRAVLDRLADGPGGGLSGRLRARLARREEREGRAEGLWLASHAVGGFVGRGAAHRELLAELDRAAADALPVLLEGETGTGKERAAERLHARTGPGRPLQRLNCAALPAQLAEAELFGCARGAFTGAVERDGLVALADGGTLFLDEFAALAGPLQAKLLRVLESGEYRRVGDPRERRASLKLVAATSESARLRSAGFRQDLLQRLAAHRLRLPPLRERGEELELLVAWFLREAGRRARGHPLLEGGRPERLRRLPWPGNVRQLRFFVLRLSAAGATRVDGELARLEAEAGPTSTLASSLPFEDGPLEATLRRVEAAAVRRALEAGGGDKRAAARRLGLSLPTLYAKLRRLREDAGARPAQGAA